MVITFICRHHFAISKPNKIIFFVNLLYGLKGQEELRKNKIINIIKCTQKMKKWKGLFGNDMFQQMFRWVPKFRSQLESRTGKPLEGFHRCLHPRQFLEFPLVKECRKFEQNHVQFSVILDSFFKFQLHNNIEFELFQQILGRYRHIFALKVQACVWIGKLSVIIMFLNYVIRFIDLSCKKAR